MTTQFLDLTGLSHYDAKIKEYIKNNLPDAAISLQVVETLPSTGEKNIIYLVKQTPEGKEGDNYDEYIWLTDTSTYEHIGTTQVALDDLQAQITKNKTDIATNVESIETILQWKTEHLAEFTTTKQIVSSNETKIISLTKDVTTNSENIEAHTTQIATLQQSSHTHTSITNTQIDALFA